MGTRIHKWCHRCCKTHVFTPGKACEYTKVIKVDLSQETLESAEQAIDIAKEVASTESNDLPRR